MDRMRIRALIVLFALFVVAQPLVAAIGAPEDNAEAGPSQASALTHLSERSIRALRASADGTVFVSTRKSTGVAGFVRVGRNGDLFPASVGAAPAGKALGFFREFGGIFGIRDTSQLKLTSRFTDELGAMHLTYEQLYQGLPVFGGVLKAHLDAANRLTAVNGVYRPGHLDRHRTARLSASQAAARAIAEVVDHPPTDESGQRAQVEAADLSARSTTLLVYRTGLIRDVRGHEPARLRGRGHQRRRPCASSCYVHAHAGKILNRFSAVDDALFRRVLFEQQHRHPGLGGRRRVPRRAQRRISRTSSSAAVTRTTSSPTRSAATPTTARARSCSRSTTTRRSRARTPTGTARPPTTATASPPTTSSRTSGATPTPSSRTT